MLLLLDLLNHLFVNLHRVYLQIEVLVLDEAVDPLRQNALQVALTGTTTSIGRHHPRYGSVRTKQGTELGSSFKL